MLHVVNYNMQVRRDPPRERGCALWHGIILYCESCATQAPLWHTAILTLAAVSFCRHTDATYDFLLKNYRLALSATYMETAQRHFRNLLYIHSLTIWGNGNIFTCIVFNNSNKIQVILPVTSCVHTELATVIMSHIHFPYLNRQSALNNSIYQGAKNVHLRGKMYKSKFPQVIPVDPPLKSPHPSILFPVEWIYMLPLTKQFLKVWHMGL